MGVGQWLPLWRISSLKRIWDIKIDYSSAAAYRMSSVGAMPFWYSDFDFMLTWEPDESASSCFMFSGIYVWQRGDLSLRLWLESHLSHTHSEYHTVWLAQVHCVILVIAACLHDVEALCAFRKRKDGRSTQSSMEFSLDELMKGAFMDDKDISVRINISRQRYGRLHCSRSSTSIVVTKLRITNNDMLIDVICVYIE